MPEHALLLSIRPKFAAKIFNGTKTVELRRVRPRVAAGDLVLVYVSSPVKALLGGFEVARVVVAQPPQLWKAVKSNAGVTRVEFDDYYAGAKQGYGIFVNKKWTLDKPVELENLRKRHTNFRPPQSYHYLTTKQANLIGFERLFWNARP